MAEKYIPKIGDVVTLKGGDYVVVSVECRENYGSVCYDRTYYFVREAVLKASELVETSELINSAYPIHVRGSEFPDFVKSELAPYEITTVSYTKIRRKQAKTITIYE